MLASTIASTDESDYLRGIASVGGDIYLAFAQRLVKSELPNNTLNWDIAIQKWDQNHKHIATRVLDLDNEDFITGFKNLNNALYLFGANGFEQADTNSWVSDPQAHVTKIDSENLNILDQLTFRGQRATIAWDLSFDHSSNQLVLVGSTDGPITHSTDTHKKGFIAKMLPSSKNSSSETISAQP